MPGSEESRPLVVCDASPLIFLAKINHLALIETVTRRKAIVLRCVADEVMSNRASPLELDRLRRWFHGVEVVAFTGSLFPSQALSRSDQSCLAWAVENRAEWLLADERLLRRFAREQGLQVIGFCGLLLKAVEAKHLSREAARSAIDSAIRDHGFRISIELYQAIGKVLGADEG
jgi:predicted nucleic acid-binding protein